MIPILILALIVPHLSDCATYERRYVKLSKREAEQFYSNDDLRFSAFDRDDADDVSPKKFYVKRDVSERREAFDDDQVWNISS
jgi:hypothetical protein